MVLLVSTSQVLGLQCCSFTHQFVWCWGGSQDQGLRPLRQTLSYGAPPPVRTCLLVVSEIGSHHTAPRLALSLCSSFLSLHRCSVELGDWLAWHCGWVCEQTVLVYMCASVWEDGSELPGQLTSSLQLCVLRRKGSRGRYCSCPSSIRTVDTGSVQGHTRAGPGSRTGRESPASWHLCVAQIRDPGAWIPFPLWQVHFQGLGFPICTVEPLLKP